jgi:hypothetical protein
MPKGSKGGKGPSKPENAGSTGLGNVINTNLISPVLRNVWTYIVTGSIGVGSALYIAGWHAANNQIKNYLAAAVSEKLNDEINDAKGPLYSAFSTAMVKMRQYEVGAVNAGAFILNQSNPSYELFVYMPPDKNYTAGCTIG